jgi:hypothetical protein
MKKILLILGISLFSFNSYAFEQVIGVSGGYSYSQTKISHIIDSQFKEKNPNYDSSKPVGSNNQEYLTKVDKFANIKHGAMDGYNLNAEYQLRFDVSDIKNFLVLGAGYTNENMKLNPKYQDLDSLNYGMNDIYLLGMITLAQGKGFALRFGGSVGNGFFKIDSYNNEDARKYNNFTANLLIDGEYSVSSNFMLFSRVSYMLEGGKKFTYDTNMTFDNAVNHIDNQILSNKFTLNPQEQFVRLNFGVRYKI